MKCTVYCLIIQYLVKRSRSFYELPSSVATTSATTGGRGGRGTWTSFTPKPMSLARPCQEFIVVSKSLGVCYHSCLVLINWDLHRHCHLILSDWHWISPRRPCLTARISDYEAMGQAPPILPSLTREDGNAWNTAAGNLVAHKLMQVFAFFATVMINYLVCWWLLMVRN